MDVDDLLEVLLSSFKVILPLVELGDVSEALPQAVFVLRGLGFLHHVVQEFGSGNILAGVEVICLGQLVGVIVVLEVVCLFRDGAKLGAVSLDLGIPFLPLTPWRLLAFLGCPFQLPDVVQRPGFLVVFGKGGRKELLVDLLELVV